MGRSGGREFDPSSGQIAEPESVVRSGSVKWKMFKGLLCYFLQIFIKCNEKKMLIPEIEKN